MPIYPNDPSGCRRGHESILKTKAVLHVGLSPMKKSLVILLGAILVSGGCAPVYYGPSGPPPPNVSYVVAVGDRPYYTHGPYYIQRGARYIWVPGHWTHRHGQRVWIHGRYVIRG
jgi:hypothetical protein